MHLASCTNTKDTMAYISPSKENCLFFCGDCLASNTSTVCQTHPITKGEKNMLFYNDMFWALPEQMYCLF